MLKGQFDGLIGSSWVVSGETGVTGQYWGDTFACIVDYITADKQYVVEVRDITDNSVMMYRGHIEEESGELCVQDRWYYTQVPSFAPYVSDPRLLDMPRGRGRCRCSGK